MAHSVVEARSAVHAIAVKMLTITEDPKLSAAAKDAQVAPMHAQLIAAQEEVQSWEFVENRRKELFGGDPGSAGSEYTGLDRGMLNDRSFGIVKHAGELAPLNFGAHQLKSLRDAVISRKSLKVEIGTKATADATGYVAPVLGQTVPASYEPTRILNLFPGTSMDSPIVQYLRINGTTAPAAVVPPGGLKPDLGLDSELLEARASKIAGRIGTNDESLSDYPGWAAILSAEIIAAVTSAENGQLLNGDGTGLNLFGILATSGVLTHAKGTDSPLDAIEIGLQMLRSGASHTDADVVLLNPLDLSAIRRSKSTGSGQYLAADPIGGASSVLWDTPVKVSTDVPVGTAIVGNFSYGGLVYVRESLNVRTGFDSADFTHNLTTLIGEERIALAITRPSCFAVITGLAA